jgi:uncharacterized protein (DUF433 family)
MFMIDWSLCDAVERDADKVSGAWFFRGTRIPVTALFVNLEGGARIDDFLSSFPGVSREQVTAVLEFEAKDKMRLYHSKRKRWSPLDLNLEHWVCFECRKMFKRPFRIENDNVNPKSPAHPYFCPQCREQMINMGLHFEPPRQEDIASWERMRLLADFGYFFYSEGAKSYIQYFFLSSPPPSLRELRRRLVLDEKTMDERRHSERLRRLKEE